MSTNYLTSSSNNYGLPTLSGLGLGSSSGSSGSSGISALLSGLNSITGSSSNYSGNNESFLNDIGSSLAPSASNGYNFGSGTGFNNLINSSNNFLNNQINSSIEQGITSPSDFSTNQLLNASNTSGSTPSFLSSLGQDLTSIEGGLSSGLNSLSSGASSLLNPITKLFGKNSSGTAFAQPTNSSGGYTAYNTSGQPVYPSTGQVIQGASSVPTNYSGSSATTNYMPYVIDGAIVLGAGVLFYFGIRLIENM
jgi:hypothetical protein